MLLMIAVLIFEILIISFKPIPPFLTSCFFASCINNNRNVEWQQIALVIVEPGTKSCHIVFILRYRSRRWSETFSVRLIVTGIFLWLLLRIIFHMIEKFCALSLSFRLPTFSIRWSPLCLLWLGSKWFFLVSAFLYSIWYSLVRLSHVSFIAGAHVVLYTP